MRKRCDMRIVGIAGLLLVAACFTAPVQGKEPFVRLTGNDFEGGAPEVIAGAIMGQQKVNLVYAASTGNKSVMSADFQLSQLPKDELFIYVHGLDDDYDSICPISITLNDAPLLVGPSGFSGRRWEWKQLMIDQGALRVGINKITIFNRAPRGNVGSPPWFMVCEVVVAGGDFTPPKAPEVMQFHVKLTGKIRPFPEPLKAGDKPGFKIRGTKGWAWTADQYLAEIPILAKYKMNFLMNCYLSMYDIEHESYGSGTANRWWEPLSESKKRAYEEVVRACQKNGIEWCFCTNPNLFSQRPLDYDSEEDFEALWKHYEWMQNLGVKWFCISLDDIHRGIDAAGQSRFFNKLIRRLRAKDPKAELIATVPYYWGTGENPTHRAFLEILARDLHPDVYIFWTGDAVVLPKITTAAAKKYRERCKHRLILWDNYPVNDNSPTLHLGPVSGRAADLCEVVDGYMGNPLCSESRINRIPLLTCADYAYNPSAYDPARSIEQAILHLGRTEGQQAVLKDVVELYPGMLVYNSGTGFNSVMHRFNEIMREPGSRLMGKIYIRHVEDVARRLEKEFSGNFSAAGRTVKGNVEAMQASYEKQFGH